MPARAPKRPIPPVETGCLSIDKAINAELALYNRTGNMLALWAVVRICVRKRMPLPRGVRSRFLRIANTLLRYAADDTPGAREAVADLVLDAPKKSGRGTLFAKYKLEKRNREILARMRDLLVQEQMSLERNEKVRSSKEKKVKRGSSRRSRTGPLRRGKEELVTRNQTVIYEQVAEEFGVQPETVKRLFEQDDRNSGSFAFRVIRENRDKGGIVDI
jgi:hypothetical protein